MARIEFGDIEALMDDLRQLGEDTEEMALEIVTEQQDILYEAQQKTAESMLQGPYYAGDVKAGMHVKTPFSTGNGAEARITFELMAPVSVRSPSSMSMGKRISRPAPLFRWPSNRRTEIWEKRRTKSWTNT